MKQSAVEWLVSKLQLFNVTKEEHYEILCQIELEAKAMEKQQIIDAWSDVGADGVTTAEEYYHINFKPE
jgi:hypothetical protein